MKIMIKTYFSLVQKLQYAHKTLFKSHKRQVKETGKPQIGLSVVRYHQDLVSIHYVPFCQNLPPYHLVFPISIVTDAKFKLFSGYPLGNNSTIPVGFTFTWSEYKTDRDIKRKQRISLNLVLCAC